MAGKLRIGVMGCGKIAHEDHVPGLLSARGAKVTALCDPVPEQMEALSAKFGLDAARFSEMAAFLASGLDAVVICTPNRLHPQQTLAALKAGLHVLCEKPMAPTAAAADKMVAAARKAGKILQINHTLHYWPAFIALAESVRRGDIGRVVHFRCLRTHDSTPDVGWSPGAAWFVQKAWNGGIVLDIGVHMAELMHWAAGPVTEIAAMTSRRLAHIDVPDNAAALMRFESGATGVLELSWTIPCGGGLLEVYGEKGTLRMGFNDGMPLELITHGRPGKPFRVRAAKLPPKPPNSQQAFVRAILGKAPSPTPGEVGRDAVALCEAVLKSGESGKFVKVRRF